MNTDSTDLNHKNEQKCCENARRKVIRVGSRKSELALIQTNHVISMLKKLFPSQKFEIHKMTTVGDRVLNISLPKIGEKSLFTKDLEDALRKGIVDFVVHSLKDLPTALPSGMTIGAVLEREDARDALVLAKAYEGKSLETLPKGSIVVTSSLRRTAQISRLYPHLEEQDIRGNLNTRLAKLDAIDSKYAAIILAQAGLVRLGWQDRISQTIEPGEILYAVGQGALAVECRSNDRFILEMLQRLICHETQCRVLAERSFLKTLGGGCSAPVAVCSTLTRSDNSTEFDLNIIGSVWSLDGKTEIQAKNTCSLNLEETKELEEEIIPTKRMKLSIDVSNNVESKSSTPSPPQVVDHSQLNNDLDIAGLLSVHSDAFQKCPFSMSQNAGKNNESKIVVNIEDIKCPLNFTIGQDVMGQCPYFDTTYKQKGSVVTNSCSGCPYKSTCTTGNNAASGSKDILDLTKCPFLNAASNSLEEVEQREDSRTELPLYCGIYPHKNWPLKVFEKCEQIGINLANQLIGNGALAVMECAQNEIRRKL